MCIPHVNDSKIARIANIIAPVVKLVLGLARTWN